ncbi:MAG: hypothetical protein HC848_05350 [Limnobacter sp.]|nr:hypothetical protein [Limnobacter sp.]
MAEVGVQSPGTWSAKDASNEEHQLADDKLTAAQTNFMAIVNDPDATVGQVAAAAVEFNIQASIAKTLMEKAKKDGDFVSDVLRQAFQ